MKKLIIFILIIIFISGCSAREKNSFSNKIPYYNEAYNNRYIKYKESHPNLTDEDIITRVNIGLDNSFYTNTRISNNLNDKYILINKYIKVPNDYIPNNLVIMDKYAKENISLVDEAYKNFVKMAEDIKKYDLNIRAISAYRDVAYQEKLYSNYYKNDSLEKVDTYSARPGFSEHHTGLCIDIDNIVTSYEYFEYTDEYKWMMGNSYKYGFILRYPKNKESITGYMYESWHYRYVGIKAATYIHKNDITYDEYFVKFIEPKKRTNYY